MLFERIMRILLTEDSSHIADIINKALLEESHAVDIASDGITGEERAFSEPYDLIILDLMLPGKDGIAVLKTLRKEGIQTPVLILTARDAIRDRVCGLDAGADDYLAKPFSMTELLARVRALLRRNSGDKLPVLTAGPLTLDPSTHEVHINGAFIELTSREYAILEYLIRNKNRLLTKGMIADHVWDYHFDSDYNLIEVYIRRIRKKFADHNQEKLIRTIRNAGYKISDRKR
jgi:DNA-binding response OmpR family regulator